MTARRQDQDETALEGVLSRENMVLALKVRAGRAILGISQCELGRKIGLTQKSVHRIEQALVVPKRKTVLAIEQLWRDVGISFDDMEDGGFRVAASATVIRRNCQGDCRDHGANARTAGHPDNGAVIMAVQPILA